MTECLDVAGRLAEGRPAVEHTQSYVRACQVVGYHHPDLTSHPAQIRGWYDSEAGLDLHALDHDCAQLRAAGTAITEALRMQRSQVAALAAAWTGRGGDSAVGFLQRHCAAANAVVAEVREAALRCESLRDELWQLVDEKVATAIAIDDRTLVQRPAWLAAAAAVTTGAADPAADELVRHQMTPYVDNDIRVDWLSVMRTVQARVAASYDMVTDRLATAPRAYFEIPGDLVLQQGPAHQSAQSPLPIQPAAPAAVAPAAVFPASPDPAPARAAVPESAPGSGAAPADVSAPPPAAGGSGGLDDVGGSSGLRGLGALGGLAGLASRIVAAMGDLLGSAAEQFADPLASDVVPDAADLFGDDVADDLAEGDDAGSESAEEEKESDQADEPDRARAPDEAEELEHGEPADGVAEEATTVPVTEPQPVTVPRPAAPSAAPAPPVNGSPPDPPAAGETPCEIAADELPKAGE